MPITNIKKKCSVGCKPFSTACQPIGLRGRATNLSQVNTEIQTH